MLSTVAEAKKVTEDTSQLGALQQLLYDKIEELVYDDFENTLVDINDLLSSLVNFGGMLRSRHHFETRSRDAS